MIKYRKLSSFALAAVFAAALVLQLGAYALAAPEGFGNFAYSGDYTAGQFHDVGEANWFARYVEDAYNYGFFQGKSAGIFDPGGLLTLGEAVKLAARLRSIYYTGSADFTEYTPFYAVYADYALEHGIIDSPCDYTAAADRARFAELIHNALPAEAFAGINDIPDYGICDVASGPGYSAAVYTLYRAGILTGSDRYGTFYPQSSITRAEACTVMVRLANPAARVKTQLPSRIPAEVIFTRCADAVFMIETYDSDGKSIRTGSGFFISDTGLAITNLHVIENAATAAVTLHNGNIINVRGVCAISEDNNLAMLVVEPDRNDLSCLILADSDFVESGNTVYAIGSPMSLLNTMTEGIVSNPGRDVSGAAMIQFTSPISFGSGGSPLLNTLGQVVGVTSSSFSYGQNLNLAVPVNHIKDLEPGDLVTLASLN